MAVVASVKSAATRPTKPTGPVDVGVELGARIALIITRKRCDAAAMAVGVAVAGASVSRAAAVGTHGEGVARSELLACGAVSAERLAVAVNYVDCAGPTLLSGFVLF